MIEVAEIQADTDGCTHDAHRRSLAKASHLLLLDGIDQEGDDHEEDDEEVIVCHLHVVGVHLEGSENRRYEQAPQIFTSISQHDTRNHRREISQSHHLPNMSCSNDDKEIGGECPNDGAECRQGLTEVEGSQQDIESQEVCKDIPNIVGQPKMIGIDSLFQDGTALVGW